ncbi:hypothetical protein Taro_035645, partial [Colocasia esculenta]|nr:hypothetical protein [Colocasia esculenta]
MINIRDNIFCKGSVDTTILGVDTMVQNKGRNVKKSPSQVDTSPEQVDTRDRFQRNKSTDWDIRSTPNGIRDNIFCKGSVDTTILGVDTMVQNKGRNVKKSPSQVDTSTEQKTQRPPPVREPARNHTNAFKMRGNSLETWWEKKLRVLVRISTTSLSFSLLTWCRRGSILSWLLSYQKRSSRAVYACRAKLAAQGSPWD